jgi:hypothetical protein
MKTRSVVFVLAIGVVFSCKEPGLFSSYRDLGSFSSRVEGQNQALTYLLKNYNSLPTNGDYKLKYTNDNALPSEARANALWYNKNQETLGLEQDIPDGPSCYWKNVRKDILEQAVKSSDGMRAIDTLSVPNQPANTCLRN